MIAWRLLTAIEGGQMPTIDDGEHLLAGLDDRDRSLARELAAGALRFGSCYEALAGPFLRGGRQPPALLRILAIGAHQLFACDRIPPRAAVHSTVACAAVVAPRLKGVVNAVLRRLAERRRDQPVADLPLPWARIAAADLPRDPERRYGLPRGFIATLDGRPPGGVDDLRWCCLPPPLCTRDRTDAHVAHEAICRREGSWAWWSTPGPALEGPVAAGDCVVMDRAQGRAVALAGPQAGELVCDCCAAPGGKSLMLQEHGCRVVAAELAGGKLSRLRRNLGSGAAILRQDAGRPALAAGFDLVVVDVPCSNSGVFGRRPEAKLRFDRRHLADLRSLQTDLLAGAAGLVRTGGRLLYSTCSLARSENRDMVESLSGWRVETQETAWPDAWQQGGYAALLRRA